MTARRRFSRFFNRLQQYSFN